MKKPEQKINFELLTKVLSKTATEKEKQEYERSRSADLKEFEQMWQSMEHLKPSQSQRAKWQKSADVFKKELLSETTTTKSARPTTESITEKVSWFDKLLGPAPAYALAVLLVTISGFWAYSNFFADNKIIVKRGEQKTIETDDGSKMRINSDSELVLDEDFNEMNRIVSLQGEVYLSVQKSDLPFIVNTDFASVQVVGTKFNVKVRDDWIEVAVNEGIVKVSVKIADEDSSITLRKGQITKFEKGAFPKPPEDIKSGQYPPWIYGQMVFYETELKLVAEEIERLFDVTIQITNKVDRERSITGLFKSDSLDELLTAICLSIQKNYYEVEDGLFKIY